MAVPNLAPGYLTQRKGALDQRAENERDRSFQADQASKNFLRKLGSDVLGAALNIGGDIAGSAFRDSLTKDERSAAAGTYYPDDDVMGDQGAAIRQVAESRAATELRPQASFGGAVESGFGKRGIDTGAPTLGGVKADVLRPQPPPVRAPTPAAPPSNPMLTPRIEAQFGRVLNAPVAPPAIPRRDAMDETPRRLIAAPPSPVAQFGRVLNAPVAPPALAPRGMESEALRRPIAAPPSPVVQRPAPMAQPREMRSPEVYAPPRMMPSTVAAMARETGYRDAIPSMPTSVRGLAQQAQDVRDERALGLELQRKKLLWDEQQATANVAMMQERGASATAIAAARAKEADAKAKAEEMRQLDLLMSARSRGAPKYVRGLGVYTPPQTVLPTGNTDDGLRGDIVPQGPMGRQGGTGGTGGGRGGAGASAGEAPTGDALTLVVQTRDRKGNAVGPSQPRRIQVGPSLFRAVALSPVDYGFEKAEDMTRFKENFRLYNEALPSAKKGDAAAVERAIAAQNAMVESIVAAQSKYAPEVAKTKEGFNFSPKDAATEELKAELGKVREELANQGREAGKTRRLGGIVQEVAKRADMSQVTADEVATLVMDAGLALPGDKGRFITDDGSEIDRADFEAAVRGVAPPTTIAEENIPAFNKLRDAAKVAKERKLAEREAERATWLEGLALELEAEGEADPLTFLEKRAGVKLPATTKAKKARTVILPPAAPPARPQAPAQPAAPARASTTPKFATLEDASDWVRTKPWPSDVKRATLQAIQSEQGL